MNIGRLHLIVLLTLVFFAVTAEDCSEPNRIAISGSGVSQSQVKLSVSGLTIEQQNIARRLTEDNKAGSIKHLYVVSAYSGDVLIYSTVRGKVTSSNKRLHPLSVVALGSYNANLMDEGIDITIGEVQYHTAEVLQDDGTYGSSAEYLYWWDVQDRYHQHYPSGGQIIHISDQPLAIGRVVINMELLK